MVDGRNEMSSELQQIKWVKEADGVYHRYSPKTDAVDAEVVTQISPAHGQDQVVLLKGLDASTYTFKEVKTEDHKSLLKETFDITLSAKKNEETGLPTGELESAILKTGKAAEGTELKLKDDNKGIVLTNVQNYEVFKLHTGGAGTTMFYVGGLCILEMGSDDVLPHGPQTGPVFIANGLASSDTGPLVIDLNGTSNTVNGIAWIDDWHDGNWTYARNHVVTNSSATVATLGLDVSSRTNLSEILNAKFAEDAPTTINLRKVGAGTLSVNNTKAVATLATNACLQVAEGVVSFDVDATLVRPLSVDGGSVAVASATTLDTSSLADANISIGGLTVDTTYYYGNTPTITKFRPSANGKLYLTNVSGELASNYTVPINLTTVVDAENFASWKVYVNGTEARGFVPEYVNGVLKAKFKHGLAIFVR